MSKVIRLVKVAVQPFFVLDDGKTITEINHSATIIPASEWPTYSSERFPAEVKAWQEQIDAEFGRSDLNEIVYDKLPRDDNGNYGTSEGKNNTIIETVDNK